MPDGTGESVNVNLDGSNLRVDARPARLVSLLRGPGGDPVLTAQRAGGATHTEAVPAGARELTFQVADDLAVETTRASDFVALAEESGRRVVVAFNGEVTVLPTGAGGDRFALGAHEALLVPSDGSEPRVVPVDDLSDEDQDEVSAAMEAAALAVVAPTSTQDEPTQAMPATTDTPTEATSPIEAAPTAEEAAPTPQEAAPTAEEAAPTPARTAATGAAGTGAAKGPATTPAKAGNAQKRAGGKKGKKGRPQPQKRQAPLVPAAAAAGAGAGAAGVTTKAAAPTPGSPTKKTTAPVKKASSTAPVAGAKGGGHDDDSYEDTPADRRFIAGAIVLALLVVFVLAIFVLTGDKKKDGDTTLASDSTSTTEGSDSSSSVPSTTAVPAASTSAPASSTTGAPSTTAASTTTTVKATTTTAAPAATVKYGIEPKSCVQNANNSITYTATVANQSTAAFDYTVAVVFKDAKGVSVATAQAKVDRLAAGKSAEFAATGTPGRDLANTGSCTVEKVDARPSGT